MGDSQAQVFSVRIVSIDYYMAPPIPGVDISYSTFHGGKVNEVPVIRIYGSTPAGQKTCLHMHQVLPYLYVPCTDLGSMTNGEVDSRKHSVSLALEKALKLKGSAGSKRQHVHGCDLVRARKFYGYHSSEELFVKIYFYYPQDVSRAASLLLTGAALDKVLQPYESHIPFLLQFLIDYNLYGMGHLHVAKMKFRDPVPDFSQKKLNAMADLGDGSCLNLPIWLSSTIPDGWMWKYSPQPDSSTNEDIKPLKRQSTSELEGDAIVHDIINQQSMSYAPLSQTHSDMKMVQSLIPIWEEEYEANGVSEAVPVDPNKPLPEDVLRILSDGVEFGNFMEVRDLVEGCPKLTPESIKSSMECEDLADSGIANLENANDLPSKYSKASDRKGCLILPDSPIQNVDAAETDDIDEADQLRTSGTVGSSSTKATDEDALRLLKWLASSQAAGDINSDDELARETILSPLLPSNGIEEVLQRANVDYESESQKECQDILDSIDMLNFEECNHSSKVSLNKTIPQVDGSSDDPQPTPCSDKLLETDSSEANPGVEVQSCPEFNSNSTYTHRTKRPRWGLLPISCQKGSDVLPPFCNSGTSWFGNEAERPPVVKVDEKKDDSFIEQASVIVECSTRDLMRRKRSHRVELSDAECGQRDINLDPNLWTDTENQGVVHSPVHKPRVRHEETKCHERTPFEVCEKATQVKSTSSCYPVSGELPSNSAPGDLLSETCHTSESGCQTSISTSKFPCIPAADFHGLESAETLVQFGSSPHHGENVGLPKSHDPSNVKKKDETVKLIGMTFSQKPPVIDWADEPQSDVGTSLDNCLPFFVRNNFEEELQSVSPRKCKDIDTLEPVMGVPVLYQNDGSYLFMLTPAVSPPSRESVECWLSFDCSDILRQTKDASSPVPPTSKGFSGKMMDSEDSQGYDHNSPLPESHSLSNDNPKNSNQENCCMEVKNLNDRKVEQSISSWQDTSQISGPDKKMKLTPLSQIGFRDPASVGKGQQLTLLSIEVQAETRADLRPDPRFDAINIIVLVLQEDNQSTLDNQVLIRCDSVYAEKDLGAVSESEVHVFKEELKMFSHLMEVINALDPDVLMGWDIQSGSLGYLAERAAHLGIGLLNNISRTPSQINLASGKETEKGIFSESVNTEEAHLENTIIEDEWGRTHASGVHVGGRIVLNIWRLMRNEVKLNMYSVEAVAEAVLRRKIPYIPWKVLNNWFSSGPGRARYRSVDYTLERAKLNLQIMNQLDMINRTSELARVFGIDFFSVLSRGSQYRVESMFLRLAHTQNYLAISPGNQQVANQPAMECLPLVMEPESSFYADPVIVLDFQSLYPSMVIAYNLCFCTCLGKMTQPEENILGVTSYLPDVNILHNLKRELLVTPNGVVYVPSRVRKGILPRLLEEILSTRIMVKQAMKNLAPSQQVRQRILNARQLALKLIANVTYGYTAAGFSGRMPCAELADSIVQCGRRTLETAISFVNSNEKWKARVIYGDTDSMFVLLKGRSLKEAFGIGREIASAISEMNPSPVTLKMEKVYYPCFLLTKKRYVGYSYESPDQSKPMFDAKGIETVRRDTCGAVSKTMEQSLRIYFESHNVNKVKEYILRQWTRILSGRISLEDCIFAKEVRLGTYSERTYSLPPAAIVATKLMRIDPRAEPRYAERIPYVVVHGEPGARLVDMVVDPLELLAINSPFRLNDVYYIRKQIIPALQRVFGLVGADLHQWFLDMPKPVSKAVGKHYSLVPNPLRTRIDFYYASKHCILCGDLVQGSAHLCHECSKDEITVAAALTGRTSKLEKDMQNLAAICRHCGGGDWLIESGVKCISLACSVFYKRMKVQKELQSLSEVATTTVFYPKCMVEWF